jgi:hypothetical protein
MLPDLAKKLCFGINFVSNLVRGYKTVDYTEVHPEQRRIEQA